MDNAISDMEQDWNINRPAEELSDRPVGSEDLLGQEQLRNPEHNLSDSESQIGFQSEHSSLHGEESEGDQATPLEYVVQKLYEELVHDFHGCTDEEHNEERRRHLIDAGDNHHSLAEMFNDDTFPSVLSSITKDIDSSNDSTPLYALLRSKHVLNVSTGPPHRLLFVRFAYISSNTPAICLSIARVLYRVSMF